MSTSRSPSRRGAMDGGRHGRGAGAGRGYWKLFTASIDAVEHFELLVEPGDFEDLAVGGVGGGDLQPRRPASRSLSCTFNSAASPLLSMRLRAVQVEHDVVPFERRHVRLERVALLRAEFLGRVDHDHVAKDFGGQVHGVRSVPLSAWLALGSFAGRCSQARRRPVCSSSRGLNGLAITAMTFHLAASSSWRQLEALGREHEDRAGRPSPGSRGPAATSPRPSSRGIWQSVIRMSGFCCWIASQASCAVAGDPHVVAGLLQLELGRPEDVNLVVAKQNAFGHG